MTVEISSWIAFRHQLLGVEHALANIGGRCARSRVAAGPSDARVLRYRLIHPELLAVLGAVGHGARVLIADGNYPVGTAISSRAARVLLNLAPGVVAVPQVLEAVLDAVAVEAVTVMQPPASEPTPGVFADVERLLPHLPLERLDRFAFYEAARSDDLALVVATGERRLYANVLLALGAC